MNLELWKFVIGTEIPRDHKMWLLGDVNMLKVKEHNKYFVSFKL